MTQLRPIDAYLTWCARRPRVPLLLALLLAGLGALGATRIEVDPDLESLLPRDSHELRALSEMRERVPGSTPLYLLVASNEPALNRALANALADELRRWPDAHSVITRRDPALFLEHRLLYLPEAELTDLADDIEAAIDWRECAAVPGCVNLDAEPPIPETSEIRTRLQRVPEVQAFLGFLGTDTVPEADAAKTRGSAVEAHGESRTGELCSSDGRICAVQAVLDRAPSDLAYAERVLERCDALFAGVTPRDPPPDLRIVVSGAYRNAPLTRRAVARDLRRVGALSTGLMLLLLLFQFRSARALLWLCLPLGVAALWTLGLVGWVHPRLNLISAFTLATLAGLGIDFGIHLISQQQAEQARGSTAADAMARSMRRLFVPMCIAATTTCSGYFALTTAGFRGFSETGGVAMAGIGCALVAFLALLWPLVRVTGRGSSSRAPRSVRGPEPTRAASTARCLVIAVGIGALGAALCVTGRDVQFEYDFRRLKPRVVSTGLSHGAAFHGTARASVVAMADDPARLAAAFASLREAGPPAFLHVKEPWLVAPSTFVPADQPARLRAMGRLRALVERADARLGDADRARLDPFRPLLKAGPVRSEQLPDWVQGWLTERDGGFGKLGMVYTGLSEANVHDMEALGELIRTWEGRFAGVRFASPGLLLGTVVSRLRDDAPRLVGVAVLGLFVATLLLGRSLLRTLTVMVPVGLALGMSMGVMTVLGLKLNMYNLLVFPLSLGIGIDAAVYVTWSHLEEAGESDAPGGGDTRRAVLGSSLTTAAGLGSLVISDNPGLASIGQLSLISLAALLLCNLVWLPACLQLATPRHAGPRSRRELPRQVRERGCG